MYHKLLDKYFYFSFSSEYQNSKLRTYQPYGVLLDHLDSLMSEAILLLPSGRVVSIDTLPTRYITLTTPHQATIKLPLT